ncbi:hypothetical protein C8J95_11144 [Elizabethkingia sp. YR214]|uniref:cupin domain-containing protein n=1 Tax=Elizabethkingia sp. YR214 TaxID=2135667 RepID=UPI000D48E642|nr:hypothetical protein [Elizabethkingia sp. YR214]PUB26361.1 hypothetical protein C8J95_11144 [Elizabethkingia sp. YR214]
MKNRSTTILLKFEQETSYPHRNHPTVDELFIMEGKATITGVELEKGDYLYTTG